MAVLPEDCRVGETAVAIAQGITTKGQQKFGNRSLAWEIAEAVRRTLLLAPEGARRQLIGTLESIEQLSLNELGCIRTLKKACSTADQRSYFCILSQIQDAKWSRHNPFK